MPTYLSIFISQENEFNVSQMSLTNGKHSFLDSLKFDLKLVQGFRIHLGFLTKCSPEAKLLEIGRFCFGVG
jgi:hypothetical protein